MKLFTTVLLASLFAVPAALADTTLSVEGMIPSKSKHVALEIQSSTYQAASASSSGRRGASSGQAYVVTRAMDQASSVIQDAASRGKAYNSAIISDGSSQIRLENVYLSSYSTTMGGGQSTETFSVHFQNQQVR